MDADRILSSDCERRAAWLLQTALHELAADEPLVLDPSAWIGGAERAHRAARGRRIRYSVAFGLVASIVLGASGAWYSLSARNTHAPSHVATAESPSPAAAAALTVFDGPSFRFSYPSTWKVLSGFHHVGPHGPTVMFAVGTGAFSDACSTTTDAQGNRGISCAGVPAYGVGPGHVVVFWYVPAHLFTTGDLPGRRPDEAYTTVMGRLALVSHVPGQTIWRMDGISTIEAYWDPAHPELGDQAEALVRSLEAPAGAPSSDPAARQT